MKASTAFFAVLTFIFLSCSPSSEPAMEEESPYLGDYSVIENLLEDLQTSWIRREIDRYADLLSEDFVFVFQEDDADGIPDGYWNKDEDVLAVKRIFDSPQVTAIRTQLAYGQPEDNQTTKIREENATLITVTNTFLDVDLDGGETTLRVQGDTQLFFFQMGDEAQGEDPSRWYIVEWQDLGSNTLAVVETTTWGGIKFGLNKPRPAVEATTWSAIKKG
ncbi:MAG: hypothetical protein HKN21_17530 [Candidatus Eisenbacteria bacterium]|uniref:Nuclear transport factor 2 family protein n=1 Tax=Eiseniibacteriota bacterium TaxID=2212470 RepID=A0A7Y2ECT7_UNCEI|nr:hypothetical protein [Candidatus Eisenbacteria bacterium]